MEQIEGNSVRIINRRIFRKALRKSRVCAGLFLLMLAIPAFEGCGAVDEALTDPIRTVENKEMSEDYSGKADADHPEGGEENPADAGDSAEEKTSDASSEEPQEDPDTEEGGGVAGIIREGTYENAYFGIQFDAGEDMIFTDDVGVHQINTTVGAIYGEESELQRALDEGRFIVAAYAESSRGETIYSTFNVSIQSVDDDEKAVLYDEDGEILSAEQKMTAPLDDQTAAMKRAEEKILRDGMEQLDDMFEREGYTQVETAVSEEEFLGEEHPCFQAEALWLAIPFYERQVVLVKEDYVMSLTVSSYFEDHTEELLARVTALQ